MNLNAGLVSVGVGLGVLAWFGIGAVQCARESMVEVPAEDVERAMVEKSPPLESTSFVSGMPHEVARFLGRVVQDQGHRCGSIGVAIAQSATEFRIACNASSMMYSIKRVGSSAVVGRGLLPQRVLVRRDGAGNR